MMRQPFSLSAVRMRTILLFTLFGISAAVLLSALLSPTIIVDYVRQKGVELPRTLPFESWDGQHSAEVGLYILRKPWQSERVEIIPDDCFELLRVNGERMIWKYCPKGKLDSPTKIRLRSDVPFTYIEVRVRNALSLPMGVSVFPSTADWRSFVPRFIAACFIVLLCSFIAWRTFGLQGASLSILIAGFMTRALYTLTTPFGVRAYDADAHMDYVEYLSKFLHLPPASGWEFHQPPLYYWTASLFIRGGRLLGWPVPESIPWMQLLSLAASCIALLSAAWIGVQVLKSKRDTHMLLYLALTAGLPGFIMLSSRISNDVFVPAIVFFGAGVLLRWHREHRSSDWIILWILSGIGFLTKLNTLCLPLSLVILAVLTPRAYRPSRRAWAAGCCIFLALTVWLPVVRARQHPSDMKNLILTGKAGITPLLSIRHEPEDYLTFNPIELLRHPFNTPYSNEGRRSNPFEYLFRSALFGEFKNLPVPWIAEEVLLLGMLLLPWMAYGARKTSLSLQESDAPVTILFLMTLVLWLAYITIFQFSPEQDFRFSPFFGIAAALLIVRGLGDGRGLLYGFGVWCGFAFAALSTLMLIL